MKGYMVDISMETGQNIIGIEKYSSKKIDKPYRKKIFKPYKKKTSKGEKSL